MAKHLEIPKDDKALWQRAEQLFAGRPQAKPDKLFNRLRLVHELQVQQIELELQNADLQDARANAETALERFAELFDFAPTAYFILGMDGLIQQTNFQGEKLLGLQRASISGRRFATHLTADYRPVFKHFLEKVFADQAVHSCETTLQVGKNFHWVTIEAVADSSRQTCLASVLDITGRKIYEQQLQLAATVFLTFDDAVTVADADNKIIAVNPAFTRLTGYTEQEALGRSTALLKSGRQDKLFYQALWSRLNTTGKWQGELWTRRKNGEEFLQSLAINTVFDAKGRVLRRVATATDITEKKRLDDLVHLQVNIDPLTELPNRRMFLDRLQQAINISHRRQQKLALLFLDLDHFKEINDTLGHDMGDLLLKETAQRLLGCIRETDTLARPGGDEFTLIMSELQDIKSIERVAESMLQAMSAPFQLKEEPCYISVSIGIALFPDDADKQEELLKKADQAMYAAKNQGRSRLCYFKPAMQETAEIRLRLTNDLRRAQAENQFWLAYQPIVALATGEIKKAEALLRWQHPQRGLVSPAEFIPIAEDTGMFGEMGAWVLRQAARQAVLWRMHHHPQFQVSINQSAAQFKAKSANPSEWLRHLQGLGLSGGAISLEITEGILLDASTVVAEKLQAYKNAGIQVSLDNFGTGYASLAYLKKYQIDFLKVGRDFICNLSADSPEYELILAIIRIAHVLGMQVIAEGVETEEQRDLLLQAGCDYGQGFLFSKPVCAEEFEKLFQAH